MILRRPTKHVKDQNWFAVGLDFVIVVAGVFLGIQIGNWNTDLALHHRAGKLEQQLETEMAAEALNYRFARSYYEEVQANGEVVLGDAEGTRALSDEEYLIKAFRATQYTAANTVHYAFDEIVAAGAADLIKNRDLWVDAVGVYNTVWFEVAAQESRASAYRRLFRENVPLDVQRDARLRCGDIDLSYLGSDVAAAVAAFYEPDFVPLNYPCTLSVPAERIAFAAQALREANGLAPALRFRIAELDNTNALIALADEAIKPWRMKPEAYDKATKAETSK